MPEGLSDGCTRGCPLPATAPRTRSALRLAALLLGPVLWCVIYAAIAKRIGDASTLFIDLPSFYFAADAVVNWRLSPYEPGILMAWEYFNGLNVYPFLYPPPSLPIFAPLAWLGFVQALAAVLVANLILVAVSVDHLYRRYVVTLPRGAWFWIGVAVLVLHYGFVRTVMNGQINLLVLFLVLLAWNTAANRRWAAVTGLALAAAILLKTYPAVLLGVFLMRRDWRVIGACSGGLLASALLSWAIAPAGVWMDWLQDVAPTGHWGATTFLLFEPGRYANISLNGMLSRLFDAEVVGRLALPMAAAVLAASFAVLWRLRRLPARAFHDWAFPITLVATFLVAPLSWFHHAVFLLPGLLLLLTAAAGRRGAAAAVPAAIVLFVSFYWSPIARQAEWVSTFPTLGILALWAALLTAALRRQRAAAGQGAAAVPAAARADARLAA